MMGKNGYCAPEYIRTGRLTINRYGATRASMVKSWLSGCIPFVYNAHDSLAIIKCLVRFYLLKINS
jgi:hypothetical protein